MKEFNVLCNPIWKRSLHPFYRWDKQLNQHGIRVKLFLNHKDKRIRGSENLFIYSKYFEDGWQNVSKRTEKNESELISYLTDLKKDTGNLIWFDEAASSGSSDFPIISYVDVFAKKQLLTDMASYTSENANYDLRVWVKNGQSKTSSFSPCPSNQLHKMKIAWNTSVYDYRNIRSKLMLVSNYLSYKLYSPQYRNAYETRNLDVTFRGTQSYKADKAVSEQRLALMETLEGINLNINKGDRISKSKYFKELQNTKVSISPFGFGEICYRDFETFISGSILLKPSIDHLLTLPNLFLPNETYVSFAWDLSDLNEKVETIISNYNYYKEIAKNGQILFRNTLDDSQYFIDAINRMIA